MSDTLPEFIHDAFGLNEAQLKRLIARSPHTYKIYPILKKNGGVRIIAQPAKETKFIQHWLISKIFSHLPVHECAAAYKTGSSIKANAAAHAQNQYISKFDFESFFGSIKASDLANHLSRHLGLNLSSTDIRSIVRLSCISPKDGSGLCLSIGAPSSPVLSNSIMNEFDEKIFYWCSMRGVTYTRYADDLTFSANKKEVCLEIEPVIQEIIRTLPYPRLRINQKKTIHLSKKNQRRITGIIINNEGNISIGRERKRMISALIHQFSLGILPKEKIYNLQGLLGFSADIEPEFLSRMRNKYGSKIIDDIFEIRKPSRVKQK
jgi:RNA-directed DNA polymerase